MYGKIPMSETYFKSKIVLLITPFSRASPTSWFGAAHPKDIKHKKMKIGAIILAVWCIKRTCELLDGSFTFESRKRHFYRHPGFQVPLRRWKIPPEPTLLRFSDASENVVTVVRSSTPELRIIVEDLTWRKILRQLFFLYCFSEIKSNTYESKHFTLIFREVKRLS